MTNRLTLPAYLAASATSLFGNASISVVLPWLVLTRTGDPALTGLVAAASGAPAAVAALVGGHLVDRIGRRLMCVISDIGSAVSVAALAVVDATVGLGPVTFIVLGILGALFDVPGMTARQALMADVAEASGVKLDKVAAAQSTLFGLSFLVGPALAGFLLAWLPAIQVVWITAACSGLAALFTAVMPLPRRAAQEVSAEEASPLAGWRIVRGDAALAPLMLIGLASMILVAPLLAVILPGYFRSVGDPAQLGLSLSAYAIGSVAGSGLYGALFSGRRRAAWVISNLLFGGSFTLIATLAGFWPIAVGMALAGVGSGLQGPVVQVLLTERVPDAVRGRVFGLYSALASVASPIGLGLMALLLVGAPLQAGAVALSAAWVAVAIWAIAHKGINRAVGAAAPATTEVGGDADD